MLEVWYNGSDHVIAESKEDAIKVWEETTGDTWKTYEEEGEDWEIDNRDFWNLWYEDFHDAKKDSPESSHIEMNKYGYWTVRDSQEEWVKKLGRAWFCSENW